MNTPGQYVLTTLLAWVSAVCAQPVATFEGLGLYAGQHSTYAYAVSDDGRTIGGYTYVYEYENEEPRPVTWTDGQAQAGGYTGWVRGVSADGANIASEYVAWGSILADPDTRLVYWGPPPAGSTVLMPHYECMTFLGGISAGGDIVVGNGCLPFRWSPGAGYTFLSPAGPKLSGVSADGSVIIGNSSTHAVMWRNNEFRTISNPPGLENARARATAVSRDGTITVGYIEAPSRQPVRAIMNGPFRLLPYLPGHVYAEATATNADGNVVVGWSTATHFAAREGFIWTRSAGMRNLKQRLLQWGAHTVADWTYLEASGISGDGRYIVGTGRNPQNQPEAFLATIPPFCYANCDNSFTAPILNIDDFTCFINRFAANDPYANCDNSTTAPVLNVDDFTCFINLFAAGCPQ